MDTIIDANIIRKDLKLNDKNFEILKDYLAKTNSKLILPSIVIEEVKGLFKRVLLECINEYKKSLNKLNRTLLSAELPDFPELDIDEETNKYIEYLNQKLEISEDNIILYKNDYLPELVSRAIQRKKPLDNKGQQFRDGLLWLTILDFAETAHEKTIAFVSDNSSDFSDKGNAELSKELLEETKARNLNINYFRNLDDFVKEQASIIDFITWEWIESNIDFNVLAKLFDAIIDTSLKSKLLDSFDLERNGHSTGYIEKSSYSNKQITDFYVYEKSDGTILLNLNIMFEIEFEIEVEKEIEGESSRFEYTQKYNPLTDDFDLDAEYIPGLPDKYDYDYKYFYPSLVGKYVLTINDKKIVDYEFKDWDWG